MAKEHTIRAVLSDFVVVSQVVFATTYMVKPPMPIILSFSVEAKVY